MKIVAERHPRPGLLLHNGGGAGWSEGFPLPAMQDVAIDEHWRAFVMPANPEAPSRSGMYIVRPLGKVGDEIIIEQSQGWPSGPYQDWIIVKMTAAEFLAACEMSRQFQYWLGLNSAETGQWWPAKREQIRREAERKREIPLPSI